VLLKPNSTEDVDVFRKIRGDEFVIVKRVGAHLYGLAKAERLKMSKEHRKNC